MKKLSVVVAGSGQIRDVEIQPGTTAGDILHQLNLSDYLLSKGPNEPFFAAAESVYDKVKDGEKIQQDIDDALAKLAPALKKAKRQVASMRTDYPLSLEVRGNVRTGTEIIGSPANPKFMSDLAKFMNPFTSKFNNVYSTLLRAFKTPGLKPIVNKTPECQNFG